MGYHVLGVTGLEGFKTPALDQPEPHEELKSLLVEWEKNLGLPKWAESGRGIR